MRPDQIELLTRARYLIDQADARCDEAIVEARDMASHALDWRDVADAHLDHHRRAGNAAGAQLWADYKAKAEAIAAHHLGRLEMMLSIEKAQNMRRSA